LQRPAQEHDAGESPRSSVFALNVSPQRTTVTPWSDRRRSVIFGDHTLVLFLVDLHHTVEERKVYPALRAVYSNACVSFRKHDPP
jgi:hypothetical protein